MRDCKIRSLSILSISCCTRPHVFISLARLEKLVQLAWTFFQSFANDDVKVSKTQKFSAKTDRFRTRLTVWILMQLISQSETWEVNLEFAVEQSRKEKAWKTFYCDWKTWKAFSINNILANFYFYSSSCYFFKSKWF